MLKATFEFSGFGDYWGGNGRRWDDNAGCLFAHYSTDTTLRDLVDMWVDDFNMGGDCDSFPENVTGKDVRSAIMDSLTEKGREDYKTGAISEFSVEYANVNDLEVGVPLDEQVDEHGFDELPVAIVLIEYCDCDCDCDCA